jgi:hypothetical protein
MLDQIKTVTILASFTDTNTFQYQISVPFPVDDVIIKYLSFNNYGLPPVAAVVDGGGAIITPAVPDNTPDGPKLSILRSDLIDNNVIATFPLVENFFEAMNTPFRLSNPNVNNTYTFTVLNINGGVQKFTSMQATVVLVFIKYADK